MMRVGFGSDVHRTDASRPLRLGGVPIAEGPGLAGHSDADVLLHAVADAILGAAGLGDIGQHFPPGDPRWANADSARFVQTALALAREAGWRVVNIDAVVRAQRPKLAPYLPAMRQRVAQLAEVPIDAVNVKAKSGEGVDAVGRGEAIAAEAICLLERSP